MMIITMSNRIFKQCKIFNSIIKFIPIYMVDYFCSFKSSPKVFFHDKSMFKNVSAFSFFSIFGKSYTKVVSIFSFSTFPFMTLFSNIFSNRSFTYVFPNLFTTFFTNSIKAPTFFTTKASSFIPLKELYVNNNC